MALKNKDPENYRYKWNGEFLTLSEIAQLTGHSIRSTRIFLEDAKKYYLSDVLIEKNKQIQSLNFELEKACARANYCKSIEKIMRIADEFNPSADQQKADCYQQYIKEIEQIENQLHNRV